MLHICIYTHTHTETRKARKTTTWLRQNSFFPFNYYNRYIDTHIQGLSHRNIKSINILYNNIHFISIILSSSSSLAHSIRTNVSIIISYLTTTTKIFVFTLYRLSNYFFLSFSFFDTITISNGQFYYPPPSMPSSNPSPSSVTIIESITIVYHYHVFHIDITNCERHCSTIDYILLQMNRLHVYIILFIGIKSMRSTTAAMIYYYYIVLQMNAIQWISLQHLLYYYQKQQEYEYKNGKMYTIIDTITTRKKRKTINDLYTRINHLFYHHQKYYYYQ